MDSSEQFVTTIGSWLKVFMRRSMGDFILYAKQNGLSMTQVGALMCIHRKGASCVSDISDELDITHPAASQLLERMVQMGFITRTEDLNDRRLKKIVLTEQGEAALRQGFINMKQWVEDLAEQLSAEEQRQVIAALNILLEKTQQLEPSPSPDLIEEQTPE